MPDYGWNTGNSLGSTGRFNAMSPSQLSGAPAGGSFFGRFNPFNRFSSFGAPATATATPAAPEGPGFWSSFGHGLVNTVGRGIGLLPQFAGLFGGSNAPVGGVTASAGGWKIDKYGNLIGSDAPSVSSSSSGSRPGPSPISHETSIPGYALQSRAEILKRNLI